MFHATKFILVSLKKNTEVVLSEAHICDLRTSGVACAAFSPLLASNTDKHYLHVLLFLLRQVYVFEGRRTARSKRGLRSLHRHVSSPHPPLLKPPPPHLTSPPTGSYRYEATGPAWSRSEKDNIDTAPAIRQPLCVKRPDYTVQPPAHVDPLVLRSLGLVGYGGALVTCCCRRCCHAHPCCMDFLRSGVASGGCFALCWPRPLMFQSVNVWKTRRLSS